MRPRFLARGHMQEPRFGDGRTVGHCRKRLTARRKKSSGESSFSVGSWGFCELDLVFPVAQPVALELGHIEVAAAFAGAGGCVDLLQIDRNDAGISLRGGQVFMAKQLLDVAHVCPSFEHFGGTGMA